MTPRYGRLSLLVIALTLGACTSSGGAATSEPTQPPAAKAPVVNLQPSVLTATPTPEPSASPSASPSDGGVAAGQPTPGPIDPCTLLTTDEASTLIGTKLGDGVSTTVDPLRVCTFKKGTTEVKLFLGGPTDTAAADAYWDSERAQVPADIPLTDLTLFDRSAFGSGSAGGLSIGALFAIDGNYFFDLYCGLPACTKDASITAAQLIAGRLP
jgi:hypothetical protein